MDKVPISYNYSGYLDDSLITYKKVGSLIERYEAAKENTEVLTDTLRKRQNAFCGKNFVIACLVAFVSILPIAIILRLIFPSLMLFVLVGSVIIPAGGIFVIKQLYENYVLTAYEDKIDKELSKNQKVLEESYNDLMSEDAKLTRLSSGMDQNCRYPLAAFIMREMATRGQINNIHTGCVRYLQNYESLGKAEGDTAGESIALKGQIDDEREKYDNIYFTLTGIKTQTVD